MADKLVTVEEADGTQVELGESEVEQYLLDHPGAHVVEEPDEESAGKSGKAKD